MASVGLSALLLGSALFGRDGFLAVVVNGERLNVIRQEIKFLEVENKRLRGRVHSLKNDLRSIERIAREDLGLVLPGETVYEFIYATEDKPVKDGAGFFGNELERNRN